MPPRQRPQGARRARRARLDLEAGAIRQGWSLDTEVVPAQRIGFPAHLRAQMLRPQRRERVVAAADWELTSWRCARAGASRFTAPALRLHVLRFPAPGVRREIYFGRMPEAHRPIVMPEVFRDRVALLPEAQVMAGGDIEPVLAELEPLLGRIAAPRLALVVWPGEVDLLALEEPDTAALQERLLLARDIVSALDPA